VEKLHSLNPRIEIIGHAENVSDSNALQLISNADVIVDAAPLFEERFAINLAAVRLGKPMVECAMYALEATITTFIPGLTGCLACLYPETPPTWTRRFPVLGAVSGTVACLGAVEAVKLLTSLGTNLSGTLLKMDLGTMEFRRLRIQRDPHCPVCKAC
jgi:molybdopterin/thiamine biosynthesis adenylyltransferase